MTCLSVDDFDLTLRPVPKGAIGGEWDQWRSLPTRIRRRLTGAGLAGRRYGLAPDQLAEALNDRYGLDLSTCEAVALWAREGLRTISDRQRLTRQRRYARMKVAKAASAASTINERVRT